MRQYGNTWIGSRKLKYFVTGHTGFKGSWLLLKLREKGHEVIGYSLDPLENGIYETAQLSTIVEKDIRMDIRDYESLESEIKKAQPEIVVHLAAQPLVGASYENPSDTFEINVTGTLNLLRACQTTPSIKAIAVITTDKVYENLNQRRPFVENDPLGLGDPYSTSKAMADLLTQSWMKSVAKVPVGVFRAGNVIGGGDVSPNRLIPDIVNAQRSNRPVQLRNPSAVRPWQHVLDCLEGYQRAIDWMLANEKNIVLNFGPDYSEYRTVGEIAKDYVQISGRGSIEILNRSGFPEADFLTLDSSRARSTLNWNDKLSLQETLKWTHEWYLRQDERLNVLDISIQQIREYEKMSSYRG